MGIVLAILLLDSSYFSMNWDIFFWRGLMESMCMNSGSEWGRHWHTKDRKYRLLSENTADRRCVCDGEDEKEDLSEGSFNSKSPWRRISVIAAGPVFNFILAFIGAFIIICFVGVDKPVIGTVNAGTPAAEAGLQAGDEIVKINDKNIHIFKDISTYNQFHQGQTMKIVYKRNGEKNTVSVTPEKNDSGYYLIGITSSNYVKTNVFETAAYSAYNVKYWINLTIDSLKQLVTGRIGVDQLSGPVGIVSAVDTTYKESKSGGALLIFLNLLQMTILLSANL